MDACGREGRVRLLVRRRREVRGGLMRQLSPINSPYPSPSFSTVTTYSHCFAIWWLHLLLYVLYFVENNLFAEVLRFSFLLGNRRGSAGDVSETSPIVTGLAYPCGMSSPFVSRFIVLILFQNCSIIRFPQLAGK